MNETKQIAYWLDGYFIADEDAAEQAEILDSVDAFGSQHGLLEVPINASDDALQVLVNKALSR